MAPRVDRRSIEKYFDFINDQAACKLCSHTLKSDRIFNLKAHAINVHKINENEFAKVEKSEKCDKSVWDGLNNIAQKKHRNIKVDITKKQLYRSYIGLVTEDSIPFNILNSENFKSIIDPICRGLSIKYGKKICLNSSNCLKVLKSVSDNIRDAINTDLRNRLLSFKIDCASRLSRNVFAISAQFNKDNEIQSSFLGMVELKSVGASFSKSLATEILNTLTKYDISMSQIVSITSDNGANVIKTSKIVSHCSIFEDDHDERVADVMDDNEDYLKNIQMFEDFSHFYLGEIQICRFAAHTAQLCSLDVLRDTKIKNMLLSCRNLVKFIKKPSNGYREIFQQKNLKLPQLDCPTVWGSTYNMIQSLKNAKEVLMQIEPIKNKSKGENFDMNECVWHFVEAYCISFEPLQHTIIKFQQEQLHYGNFYAEWLKCKICTEKILEKDDIPYVEKIAKSVLRSMEIRTTKFLNNEHFISCLYLDPRFSHTLTATQKLEAANCLKKLYDRIKSLNINIPQPQQIKESPTSSSESIEFSQKADEYLNEYLSRRFVSVSNETIDVYTKIENLQLPYLRADSNVLHFWRDRQLSDPELYALSNICFAVPATHVTIESAFSSLKLTLADSRNRLNHSTLENILLVKLNAGYLDQAIEVVV